MNDKTVGLILALSSTILIGISFIVTKLGLLDSQSSRASAGEHYNYLQSYKWWIGMLTMGLGEAANFAAYSFAPAILVTPLGAGSVIIGSILASIFLGESLGVDGVLGCSLSIIGSVVIILHAPDEIEPANIDEILAHVVQPGFLVYILLVLVTSFVLIYKVSPRYGKTNMMVYISICSLVGSISVVACKAFGMALRFTLAGNNQFTRPSTYFFALVVVVAILVQMNYFNKALELFSTNRVTPIYYVFFTTATIIASSILFQTFSNTTPVNAVSIFCGFATIFIGVFLLNYGKQGSTAIRNSPELDGIALLEQKGDGRVSRRGSFTSLVPPLSLNTKGFELSDEEF